MAKRTDKLCEVIIIDQTKDLNRHAIAVTRFGRQFVPVDRSWTTEMVSKDIEVVSPIKKLQIGARVKFMWKVK